ncbi:Oidioi.mRNA.OKI2018_I69.chr2.g6816.t1.cds [Oikopleura dioica]|uniref:Oidioi.mRNA.OKI2018_I69.chr2.g6816.t1.cds n=1 Tax=Oikopleura dioica TaxID=34765 RepID=A0ABN7T802_OIKDI|nr:Oidioi.mRNA.OKI2018_I69.chr2.g6816.t1.cds [Oikopleura dioica]
MTDNVDDFFNRKEKKRTKKTKKTKVVTAEDIFKGNTTEENTTSGLKEEKEDEWIEAAGEQEFVFDSVGGMKRLELEERQPSEEGPQSEGEGERSDDENAESGWKTTGNEVQSNNVGLPGDNKDNADEEADSNEEKASPAESSANQPKKYVPPSQRQAAPVSRGPPASGFPGRRNRDINVDSVAEFPTLGASVETTPEGFEQVNMRKGGAAWSSGGGSQNSSTGIQNRFQLFQN